MTKETINRNRELYIKEFKATGLPGVEHIISYLDSHHFFEARCNGHDHEPGGTANHSLWVLKFARETRKAILKENPPKDIPDDELVFTCLLHDVCDCNPKRGMHGVRSREIMEKRIKGFSFSLDVLDAVNSHMHKTLYGNYHVSSRKSNSKKELLHYLVFNSDHRAIEYAGGIPFGTEPKVQPYYKLENDFHTIVRYDNKEHRYWWTNAYEESIWNYLIDLESLPGTSAKAKAFLYIREWPLEPDFAILENEQGNLALFVVKRINGFGGPTLMVSDEAGFDYTEFIAYESRYPQYRSSYIVGHKTNGKWGIISAKDQFYDNNGFPIGITQQVNFKYDDPDSAIKAMQGNTGHPILVKHTAFFKKINIR